MSALVVVSAKAVVACTHIRGHKYDRNFLAFFDPLPPLTAKRRHFYQPRSGMVIRRVECGGDLGTFRSWCISKHDKLKVL